MQFPDPELDDDVEEPPSSLLRLTGVVSDSSISPSSILSLQLSMGILGRGVKSAFLFVSGYEGPSDGGTMVDASDLVFWSNF